MSRAAPAVPVAPFPGGLRRTHRSRRSRRAALLAASGIGALLLTALLFGALAVGGGEATVTETELPAASRLVGWGVSITSLAGRIAAVGTVGVLLFASALLPGRAGAVQDDSRRALRAASAWARAWALATALGGLLTVGRLTGTGPVSVPWAAVRVFVEDTGAGRAALLVTAVAVVVAVAAPQVTRAGARVLLAGALGALVLPVALSGHSSTADDQLLAVTTLGVHVTAATLWVGGLLALLIHAGRGATMAGAAQRFSRLALACFLATAVSGLLAAWLVLAGGALLPALGTGYGALIVGKTAGLGLLGSLGWWHRRRTLPSVRAGSVRAFHRLAAVEILLMLVTVTLAVALAASPPPAAKTTAPSPPVAASAGEAPVSGADPMAGHDHGELSVGVLVDSTRFHVAHPVAAGSRVTVHNSSGVDVTLTATDGAFDVVVPARTLTTFLAPERPGEYPFTSDHSASYADVLVVE